MTIANQVASNLDHLLMTDPQIAHQGIGVDTVEPHLGHGVQRRFAQTLVTDPAAVVGQVVEKQVFRHGQRGQQIQLLHDHAYP
ncbi:hypothetical protein D9M71_251830 [compost metagenome]